MGDSTIDEIAQLLDQCKPEELNEILASIENSGAPVPAGPATPLSIQPVPPSGPPPNAGKRPAPGVMKAQELNGASVSKDEIRKLLEEHSAGVISEVRRMIPSISSGVMDTIDVATLSQALAERDQEVKALEARFAELQADLSTKDKRVAELGGELDATLREVRHRQLDLEFQQLKLEEKVRYNTELEQAQRVLSTRVEEASLQARHAALEADMNRYTPRGGMHAQGSMTVLCDYILS